MAPHGVVGVVNDAHCHFFSTQFLAALSRQRGRGEPPAELLRELQWDDPGEPTALADRWVHELDAHDVSRAALIASVPGDQTSVAAAVARHPTRLVGYFMVDASAPDALNATTHALDTLGLRGVCLFPAMHHTPLSDERVLNIVELAATRPGTVMFVHCGLLSVGVRKKLGLASRFDLRLGDPLAVARLAAMFPALPFVIPHFGAGLFREALMAADSCANIYLDTSSSNGWMKYTPGLTLDDVLRTAVAVVGSSRLLFGTDSSFFPRGWQEAVYDTQRQAAARVGLTEADQAAIFGGNFNRLFEQAGGRRE
jgi:uncharacterized protein